MADGVTGKKLDDDSQADQLEGATNVTKEVFTNFVKETTNNGSWTISADGSGCRLVPGNTVSIEPPYPLFRKQ